MTLLNLYWHLGSISVVSLFSLSTANVKVWVLRCYTQTLPTRTINHWYSRRFASTKQHISYEIWGYNGGEDSYCGLLGYGTVWSGSWVPVFDKRTASIFRVEVLPCHNPKNYSLYAMHLLHFDITLVCRCDFLFARRSCAWWCTNHMCWESRICHYQADYTSQRWLGNSK
jgi:hypothetical protein